MELITAKIVRMNLSPSAPLHAHLICLPVLTVQNVFQSHIFAMVTLVTNMLVLTIRTLHPLGVTTVLLIICSYVLILVLMFV